MNKKYLTRWLFLFFLFATSYVRVQSKNNPGNSTWLEVQKNSKDTVVQIFVQVAKFNWRQPFKTPEQSKAWGSAFFIDDQGYMVSNYHVVDEAVKVKIQIPTLGKDRYEAEIVGVNPDRDIALLKLTEQAKQEVNEKLGSISYLTFGDSDKITRTQEVLALGYPLGQQNLKSTQGIVSGREGLWNESYIQITAAINSGNSGGPSLNINGEVIGINTAMVSKAQNIGYIIPINDVKSVIADLRTNKLLRKPIFGSAFNNATKDMTNYLGNPAPGGFYIAQVYKDTLFEMAGIKAGDMLYKINDYIFDKYGETNVEWTDDKVPLVSVLNRFNVGKDVNVQIYRRGESKEISFNFDATKSLPIRTMYPEFEKIDYEIIGGMVVMQLNLNLVDYFENKFPEYAKYRKRENQYKSRLIITHIFHDSQAREARSIKKGLLVKRVNGNEVFTLDDYRRAVEKDSEYLSIHTDNNLFMALSMKKVLEEEDELSQRNYYQKTDLVKKLQSKLLR